MIPVAPGGLTNARLRSGTARAPCSATETRRQGAGWSGPPLPAVPRGGPGRRIRDAPAACRRQRLRGPAAGRRRGAVTRPRRRGLRRRVAARRGHPLRMESAFGTCFEDVRVHTDDRASRSAESVGANAYTVGSDVVFKSGQYNPGSAVGPADARPRARARGPAVPGPRGRQSDAGGGIRLSSPSDRFEQAAEATADEVVTCPGPARDGARGRGGAGRLRCAHWGRADRPGRAALPVIAIASDPARAARSPGRSQRSAVATGAQISPSRIAYATACVRLRSSRRDVMSWMMFLTVRSE